jgi:hypothetical protein
MVSREKRAAYILCRLINSRVCLHRAACTMIGLVEMLLYVCSVASHSLISKQLKALAWNTIPSHSHHSRIKTQQQQHKVGASNFLTLRRPTEWVSEGIGHLSLLLLSAIYFAACGATFTTPSYKTHENSRNRRGDAYLYIVGRPSATLEPSAKAGRSPLSLM